MSRTDTSRLWISDNQWFALLERLGNPDASYPGPETRSDDRGRVPLSCRCIMRLEADPGQKTGTYLIRARNISEGGIGFVHDQPLPAGARCTIALQLPDGEGRIIAGHVVWCREFLQLDLATATFEVGVSFDEDSDLTQLKSA